MTQLIVSLEDASMLSEIKKAIRLLRGVTSVSERVIDETPNSTTLKAIDDLENGKTIQCADFDSYLNLVSGEL